MLNKQDSQLIIDHLTYLVQYGTMTTKSTADDADIWPIRHGGLLGLKWIFAVNQPLLEFNFTSLYSMLCSSLRDRSDDCRLVAVSVILPICEFICHDHLFRGIEIAQLAWALIKNGDDLTASTGSIINLLSSLMQYGKAGLNANLFILIIFQKRRFDVNPSSHLSPVKEKTNLSTQSSGQTHQPFYHHYYHLCYIRSKGSVRRQWRA